MKARIPSGPIQLAAHISHPPGRSQAMPAVVIAHGYPGGAGGAATAADTYPELADRIAREMGWLAVVFGYRACNGSEGQFSLAGWLADLRSVVDHVLAREDVFGLWLVGFGTGGALAITAAADDDRVRGVAVLGAPADFDDWASQPRRLLEHSREIGLVTDPHYPPSLEAWSRGLRQIRAVSAAGAVAPRPLLVLHGTEDQQVPDFDARVLADAHGDAELRIIAGAGHQLRHDPRAVAVLLGWLDRQRHGEHGPNGGGAPPPPRPSA